jgi:large subunit ribosomal protein L9
MAKTEVILTHNVAGLGGESDHVKVAAGYARNFLYPQGFAIPVTAANKRRLEVLRQRRGERESHELQSMTELSQTLSKLTLTITVKTGDDGKLFGSVTAGTIADELKTHYDASVDKRKIHLTQPIKTVGDYDVELKLHPQISTTLKVKVESTTPIEQRTPTAPAPGARSEGKGASGKAEARPAGKGETKPSGKAETKHSGKAEGKEPARASRPEGRKEKEAPEGREKGEGKARAPKADKG